MNTSPLCPPCVTPLDTVVPCVTGRSSGPVQVHEPAGPRPPVTPGTPGDTGWDTGGDYECAYCHEPSPALWVHGAHASIGTCEECGREAQYREAVTGLCRSCFACEWPTDEPEPPAGLSGDQEEEVTSE